MPRNSLSNTYDDEYNDEDSSGIAYSFSSVTSPTSIESTETENTEKTRRES